MVVTPYTSESRSSVDAVRNQVDKIVASESFAGATKLAQLLIFLVEQELKGNFFNEYSIALDVFNKDQNFDPRLDPLVRVHVCRLRNKLNRYRATFGVHDSIEIELPPRTYVPRIKVRPNATACSVPDAASAPRNIAVRSFRCLSSDEADGYFCEGLVEEIIYQMAKLNRLRIIPIEAVQGTRNTNLSSCELYERLRVDAALGGNVRRGPKKLRIAVHLTKAADASVLWSEMYERHIGNLFATQEEIAREIVNALWGTTDLTPREQPLHIPPDDLKEALAAGPDVSVCTT